MRRFAAAICSCVALAACVPAAAAQNAATIPVLMVSDIHFEPFRDPAKVAKLIAAPVPRWEAILTAPDSPDRAVRFAELEGRCPMRGEDTSFELFKSSLAAMKKAAAGAKFITLSGDLMSHEFECRFKALVPDAKPAEYQEFVEKTIGFVETELRSAFPQAPLYAALGNNDSNCDDYALDARSPFLANVGSVLTGDAAKPEREQAMKAFTDYGDFAATMPAPMKAAKILVLDDLFASFRYRNCAGKPDNAPAQAQVAWLRAQLEAARNQHENVWVMAHIPPGVDPYSTIRNLGKICSGASPTLLLGSDALAETLAEFGDVVRLAVFGHTHMDELRLLRPAASQGAKAGPAVPVKMVPSISPINGNSPSFVVARVDAATAALKDYKVFAASDSTGVDSQWTEVYDFAKEYRQPEFSGAVLTKLVEGFRADPQAQQAAGDAYLKHYYVQDMSILLRPFWPQYVCALDNMTAEAYRACACAKQQ